MIDTLRSPASYRNRALRGWAIRVCDWVFIVILLIISSAFALWLAEKLYHLFASHLLLAVSVGTVSLVCVGRVAQVVERQIQFDRRLDAECRLRGVVQIRRHI